MSHAPVLTIIIPLAGAFLITFTELISARIRPVVLIPVTLGHLGAALSVILQVVEQGPILYTLGMWDPPWGIVLSIDSVSIVFLGIVSAGSALLTVFAWGSPREAGGKYAVLRLLLCGAMSGAVLTGDLFNLFVFAELMTIAGTGLVALKRKGESAVAGFTYLMFSGVAGTFFLFGVALLYGSTGTLNMAQLAQRLTEVDPTTQTVAFVLMVTAFGVKTAMVPLHFWQPFAYAAAGGTTAALLSGVTMKVNLYALLRICYGIFGRQAGAFDDVLSVLLVVGMVSIIVGHGLALWQDDIRRMLAFSSVAHVGYILLGVAGGTTAAVTAGLFHAFNHFVMKVALFWSGRGMSSVIGSPYISRMNGVGRRAPLLVGVFFVAALAIVGIPPTNGFASKWLIALSLLAEAEIVAVLVLMVGTALSMMYYTRFLSRAVQWAPESFSGRAVEDRRLRAVGPLVLLAAVILIVGVLPELATAFLEPAARALLDQEAFISNILGAAAVQ